MVVVPPLVFYHTVMALMPMVAPGVHFEVIARSSWESHRSALDCQIGALLAHSHTRAGNGVDSEVQEVPVDQ